MHSGAIVVDLPKELFSHSTNPTSVFVSETALVVNIVPRRSPSSEPFFSHNLTGLFREPVVPRTGRPSPWTIEQVWGTVEIACSVGHKPQVFSKLDYKDYADLGAFLIAG